MPVPTVCASFLAVLLAFAPAPLLAQEDAPEIAGDSAEAAPPPPQLGEMDVDLLFEKLAASETEREATRLSEEISRRWSRSGSDTIDLLLKRGRDALQKGETRKAVAHFSRLIAFAPDYPEGWNARATAHFAAGDLGFSLADIYHVLRLEPRHYGALSGLAIILEQLGFEEEAYDAHKQALDLHPHLEGAKEAMKRLEKVAAGQPI